MLIVCILNSAGFVNLSTFTPCSGCISHILDSCVAINVFLCVVIVMFGSISGFVFGSISIEV